MEKKVSFDPIKSWSKRHKQVFKNARYNLSNSFAQPLNNEELIELSLARGDKSIVEEFHKHTLEYTGQGGSADLRREVAKFYGPKISAENVLIFPGAQVALQTAAMAFARGCHSIVFSPAYQSVQAGPAHAGGEVTIIRLRPENNWQIQLSEVRAAIRKDTRYMVLNEPYNPSGLLMKAELQLQLTELAEKNGLTILSDEVYRLLEHDERDQLPAMADLYRKGISCVGVSKPWGGCGICIGWLVTQDLDLLDTLTHVQYFNTASPSRASEIQAIMTLRNSDTILAKNIKIIRNNRKLLEIFFERYSDLFEWSNPNAGAIGLVEFKGPLSSEELGDQLAAVGISIKPAYVFALDLQASGCSDYDSYFRIGYGEEKFPAALNALTAFVEENKGKWRGSTKKQRVE